MEPKDFMSAEWPRWISGCGFYVMGQDSSDNAGWSERKGYFVNYDTETSLWTLTISTDTVEKDENGEEFEESSEEKIGPYDLKKFQEILATYEIEFDDEYANKVINRIKNPHLR